MSRCYRQNVFKKRELYIVWFSFDITYCHIMDFPGGLQSGLLGPAFSRSALSGPVSGRSRKQLERPNDILLDTINLRVIMHY